MRLWTMVLAALPGLLGAAGVMLAATSAHLSGEPTLKTAADFLLFHAAALLALNAVARGEMHRGLVAAASIIGLGSIVFCGDLALHAFAARRLFPMAAPIGGTLLILGWIVTAFAVPLALGVKVYK